MPPQPKNPEPAYPDKDQMLSRKFGKEIANYFSGNPLNRVGFLREDHKFLSKALTHPSTTFLPCRDLQPLAKKGYGTGDGLKFVQFDDIKGVIHEDFYEKDEKSLLEQFNSERYVPQVIFLGIDESRKEDGMEWQGKNKYTGAPSFAVDVTPKSSVQEEAEKLIQKMDEQGYAFAPGRVMEIEATHGKYLTTAYAQTHSNPHPSSHSPHTRPSLTPVPISGNLRRSPHAPRLERPQPLLRRLRQPHNLAQRGFQTRLPSKGPRAQSRRSRQTSLRNALPNL